MISFTETIFKGFILYLWKGRLFGENTFCLNIKVCFTKSHDMTAHLYLFLHCQLIKLASWQWPSCKQFYIWKKWSLHNPLWVFTPIHSTIIFLYSHRRTLTHILGKVATLHSNHVTFNQLDVWTKWKTVYNWRQLPQISLN